MASFTHEQVLHCQDSKMMDAISNRSTGRWDIVRAGGGTPRSFSTLLCAAMQSP